MRMGVFAGWAIHSDTALAKGCSMPLDLLSKGIAVSTIEAFRFNVARHNATRRIAGVSRPLTFAHLGGLVGTQSASFRLGNHPC
jgi:hypothetical protein